MLLPEICDEILKVRPCETYGKITIPEALASVYDYATDKQSQITERVNLDLAQTLPQLRRPCFST